VKKILAFLIMLVVGMALFAVPVFNENATSAMYTVEAVPQFAGVLSAVADVSPAMLAEYLPINITYFEATATNINAFSVAQYDNSLYRQEASPLYGYSKTADQKMIGNLQSIFVGWS